jgi:hypothetical protein
LACSGLIGLFCTLSAEVDQTPPAAVFETLFFLPVLPELSVAEMSSMKTSLMT